MKQHPDSVNRDLDDEVAEVIEHQYARRMVKRTARDAGAPATDPRPAADARADRDPPSEQEKPRGSS